MIRNERAMQCSTVKTAHIQVNCALAEREMGAWTEEQLTWCDDFSRFQRVSALRLRMRREIKVPGVPHTPPWVSVPKYVRLCEHLTVSALLS